MATIEIYTTHVCPYCVRAKQLLKSKGADWMEISVEDEGERAKMIERTAGKRSVPQIFINDQLIGGCDDLYALERDKKLDALLAA